MDISYKWAGGGLISTTEDLIKFGNAMLVCYQLRRKRDPVNGVQGFEAAADNGSRDCRYLLDGSTTAMMWEPVVKDNVTKSPTVGYGMGWLVQQKVPGIVGGRETIFCVGHTGSAIGASSALVIAPQTSQDVSGSSDGDGVSATTGVQSPEGVTVAVIFNLQEVKGMLDLGIRIAEEFV